MELLLSFLLCAKDLTEVSVNVLFIVSPVSSFKNNLVNIREPVPEKTYWLSTWTGSGVCLKFCWQETSPPKSSCKEGSKYPKVSIFRQPTARRMGKFQGIPGTPYVGRP